MLRENTSTFADTRILFQLYGDKETLCSGHGEKKRLDHGVIVLHTL